MAGTPLSNVAEDTALLNTSYGNICLVPEPIGQSPSDACVLSCERLSAPRCDSESVNTTNGIVGLVPRHQEQSISGACEVTREILGEDCALRTSSPNVVCDIGSIMEQVKVGLSVNLGGGNTSASA